MRILESIRGTTLKEAISFNRSMGFNAYASRILGWVVALSIVIWVVIGLVSLRFDLSANLADVLYSQLDLMGIIVVCLANVYIIDSGGFGSRGFWIIFRYSPVLYALLTSIGLILLLLHIWADFDGFPNALLKLTYSLIGIGLCGTFAGFVSLATVSSIYRPLIWAMHLLTLIVGIEIVEALWQVDVLSAEDAGADFAWMGAAIAITIGTYSFCALVIGGTVKTARSRLWALAVYAVIGLAGFGIVLLMLWGELEAGPRRFVLGASLLLAICSVAAALLHYYNLNPPEAAEVARPVHFCTGCGSKLLPNATSCASCGKWVAA